MSERKIMYAGKTRKKKKIILVYSIKIFRNNIYVPCVKKNGTVLACEKQRSSDLCLGTIIMAIYDLI